MGRLNDLFLESVSQATCELRSEDLEVNLRDRNAHRVWLDWSVFRTEIREDAAWPATFHLLNLALDLLPFFQPNLSLSGGLCALRLDAAERRLRNPEGLHLFGVNTKTEANQKLIFNGPELVVA